MPFSFLNPWLLTAALAVGIPLWLHLRRRHEKKVVSFSAVRFLEDQPRPRRKPMRLENFWLLLLRASALVLLAAAFSWPYTRPRSAATAVSESRVYILDNTLSQQANGKFETSRARLIREIDRAPKSSQVAVIELTSVPRLLSGFSEERIEASQRLSSLAASHQRGSYLAAFRLASGLLDNVPTPKKRIVFVGDNQANQWGEGSQTPPFLRGSDVELLSSDARPLPNISVSDPRARRILTAEKSLVNLVINVNHCGKVGSARLRVQANGQTVLNKNLSLGAPGTQSIQAEWEAAPGNPALGEVIVEGEPDTLAGDNHAFFALPAVVEGRVALLAQSPYLRVALSPEVMRGRWTTALLDPLALKHNASEGDVLCIESSYLSSPETRDLVLKYLNAGQGVVLFVDRLSPAIKGCLQELGFEAQPPPGKPALEADNVQFIVPNHPVLQSFASGQYGGLLDLKFSNYALLKSAEATPLLFSQTGAGLLFDAKRGPGRLYVAAFGMARDQTSWPVHPTFVPFLDLLLQAARGAQAERTSFEPGEVVTITAQTRQHASEAVLKAESVLIGRAEVAEGRVRVQLPDQPGLYTIDFGEPGAEQVIAVNPSAKESELVYAQRPQLPQHWRLTKAQSSSAHALSMAGLQARDIFSQHIWWWLLLGALAALLFEVIIADRRRAIA